MSSLPCPTGMASRRGATVLPRLSTLAAVLLAHAALAMWALAQREPPPLRRPPAATQVAQSAPGSPAVAEPVSEAPAAVPAAFVDARFDVDYLRNPAPAYPPISRRRGERGVVLLAVAVSAQGVPERVAIRQGSGFERLDEAALRAVATWRFVPARRGEQAVPAQVLVPIEFRLNG